jgi:plastocyanin
MLGNNQNNQQEQNMPETEQKKPAKIGPWKPIFVVIVVVLAAASAVTAIMISRDTKSPVSNSPGNQMSSEPSLSFSPSSQTIKAGETLTLAVWADSVDQVVNAVQSNITYPADKFELVDVIDDGSAYEIKAETTRDSGSIAIARGHVGTLTGPQLVVKLTLKALVDTGTAKISFTDGTALVSSESNQNIVSQMGSGSYSFEKAGQ